MLTLALALSLTLAAGDDDGTFRAVDYARIDRRIAKEPAYVADPLYALFLWGAKGDVRMWAVLDKTDASLDHHDVLYLDLDADGDLTEGDERFVGVYDEDGARAGMAMAIRVGDVPVPGTPHVHEAFLVSTVPKAGRQGIWFRVQWRGEEEISGGYGASGSDTTRWAGAAQDAPVLRPTALGPLSFALWGQKDPELAIGTSTRLNVIAGSAGSGPDTLAVVDEHFLDLEKDALYVTVIAKGWDGEDVRERSRIRGHC